MGNSPTALRMNVLEVHSEEWLKKQLMYLGDCARAKRGQDLGLPPTEYAEAPPFPFFPTAQWFLAVYVRDVWSRLPSLLASLTSTYGSIIKIDSSKKICKKLQGAAVGTASWATSIGNEKGEVIQCILTTSEAIPTLQRLADGLMERFRRGNQQPPILLYTDRDCCSNGGPSKYQLLFSEWRGMEVRLDVWHFMRRIAAGIISEAHPLYGVFMSRLSGCLFEWDTGDYERLVEAKMGELVKAGVSLPSVTAAKKSIVKEEMARHCRRRTRGVECTGGAIEALLLSFATATDTLGVPLLKDEMQEIWEEQKHHLACLQDPPGVELYTITGHIKKGGMILPVLRCARGSTSLESFHLHLARFVPGTAVSAVNFHAFLLDGLTRWNSARAAAAIQPEERVRTFDMRLASKVNALSHIVHNKAVLPLLNPPSEYTGELFGVEYLFNLSGVPLHPTEEEGLVKEIDEGFEDVEDEDVSTSMAFQPDPAHLTIAPPEDSEDEEEETEETIEDDNTALDASGIPGWDRVDALAEALVSLKGLSVTNAQAKGIQQLYHKLLDYDKKPLTFRPRPQKTPRGRFGRRKQNRSGHLSIDAMKR